MEISVLFESFEAGNAAEEKRATGIKCCIKSSWFYDWRHWKTSKVEY